VGTRAANGASPALGTTVTTAEQAEGSSRAAATPTACCRTTRLPTGGGASFGCGVEGRTPRRVALGDQPTTTQGTPAATRPSAPRRTPGPTASRCAARPGRGLQSALAGAARRRAPRCVPARSRRHRMGLGSRTMPRLPAGRAARRLLLVSGLVQDRPGWTVRRPEAAAPSSRNAGLWHPDALRPATGPPRDEIGEARCDLCHGRSCSYRQQSPRLLQACSRPA